MYDGQVKITGFGIQSPLFQEYRRIGSLHDPKTKDLNSLVEIIGKLIPHRFVETPELSRLSLFELKEKLNSLGGADENSQKTIAEKVRSNIPCFSRRKRFMRSEDERILRRVVNGVCPMNRYTRSEAAFIFP